MLLRDADIRRGLHRNLSAIYRRHARIVPELEVVRGQARVDLAVIHRELCGYEIKSDVDTLLRLPRQIRFYDQVLDRMTLVVTRRHLHAARPLLPVTGVCW